MSSGADTDVLIENLEAQIAHQEKVIAHLEKEVERLEILYKEEEQNRKMLLERLRKLIGG